MNVWSLRRRCAYDEWAIARLLAAAAQLTREEFTRDLLAGFRSIHGTLVHLATGERRWLHFLRDGSAFAGFVAETVADAAAIAAVWAQIHRERTTFLDLLTDESLEEIRLVHGVGFSVAELLEHLLTHSVHHRGQIALLLRQLGHAPPVTDFRRFVAETRASGAD